MTSKEFCYWLQGLFELGKPTHLDAAQTEMVKRHLALVFQNVTAEPTPQRREALEQALRAAGQVHGSGCTGISIC